MSRPNPRVEIAPAALSPARVVGPHNATRDFEAALCEYTGAPYAVAVSSCTMALLLAVAWWKQVACWRDGNPHGVLITERGMEVEIPKRTYVSVPMSIIHAGGRPIFRDEEWRGAYQLKPLPVWDSARYLSGGMYFSEKDYGLVQGGELPSGKKYEMRLKETVDFRGQMVCVSFHASKTLGDTQGGAILHDNAEADAWLRKARFDGRTEGVPTIEDRFNVLGWHCYMSPDVAARLLWKLSVLPRHNDPLPNDDYPDLSTVEIFR